MKFIKFLDEYMEEIILIVLLIIITMIMGIQVCARYIFNYSLAWSEEITRYLYIWSGFISVSYCTKKCISIKVEQFVSVFPGKIKIILKIINHSIEFIFFFYLIPFAYKYLISAIESNQISTACGIPMYFVQLSPLVGFVLVEFRIIQCWYNEFKKIRKV